MNASRFRPRRRATRRERNPLEDGSARPGRASLARLAGLSLAALGLLVLAAGLTASVQARAVADPAPSEPAAGPSGDADARACLETHEGPPPSVTIDPRDCTPERVTERLPDRPPSLHALPLG